MNDHVIVPSLRWVIVVLLVAAIAVGGSAPFVVRAANQSATASHAAQEASNRAALASDRAAAAASQASTDLSAALKAANNPQQAAAVNRALGQIDTILRLLCADRPGVCDGG